MTSQKPRTPAQIEASRRNGRLSRGPVTDQGKRNSSRNATKHGFYSRAARELPPHQAIPRLHEEIHTLDRLTERLHRQAKSAAAAGRALPNLKLYWEAVYRRVRLEERLFQLENPRPTRQPASKFPASNPAELTKQTTSPTTPIRTQGGVRSRFLTSVTLALVLAPLLVYSRLLRLQAFLSSIGSGILPPMSKSRGVWIAWMASGLLAMPLAAQEGGRPPALLPPQHVKLGLGFRPATVEPVPSPILVSPRRVRGGEWAAASSATCVHIRVLPVDPAIDREIIARQEPREENRMPLLKPMPRCTLDR